MIEDKVKRQYTVIMRFFTFISVSNLLVGKGY